ncbi:MULTISPECIES: lipocalin-like domain-containing protein [Methylorubrum]|uniref:lipocalin-like domain-containing protein n=1 Tax=Methylorubrum TaxID=2282523 RepID=UPI0031F8724B
MRTTMRMPAAATLAVTLAVTLAASSAPTVARAESDTPLKGLWKLVSYEVEVRKDGETLPVMGEHPTGYAYFTPEKRVFFVLTGEGRKPAKDDAQRAQLLETLVSYTGKFRLDGDKWIADLDVAWDPKWVGTEQTRTFTLDGERLRVLTPWRVMPNWADKGETRSIVTFQRAKD